MATPKPNTNAPVVETDEEVAPVDVETDSPAEEKEKMIHVGASIPQSLFDQLENYRWEHRLNKSQVIVVALQSFCQKQND